MRVHWTALGVGFVVGLVVGYAMKGAGANKWGISGRWAAPLQMNIDKGRGARR